MEQITKEELLDVIGKFELGDNTEVVSVEPYGSGHINDTFRLEVKEDGQEKLYILQRMNKDIFKNQKELMENILQVTSFLTDKIKAQGGDPNRETLQPVQAERFPVVEPFQVSVRFAEELQFHLFELSGTECKVTRCDLVTE